MLQILLEQGWTHTLNIFILGIRIPRKLFRIDVVFMNTLVDVAPFPKLWRPLVEIFLIALNILSQNKLLSGIKSRNLANSARCLKQVSPEYRSICLDIWCQM